MNIKIVNQISQKQLEAFQLAMLVLKTPEFKDWFLNTTFTELRLSKLENLTNAQIFEHLYASQDEVQVKWVSMWRPWYKRWSSVIGWAEWDCVFTYTQQINRMGIADLAAHFFHELHHLKPWFIEHSFNPSTERDRSIPYQVGNYVEKAVREMRG